MTTTPCTYNLGLINGGLLPDRERTRRLVRMAQAGDDVAFTEIVRAYQDIAVAYAMSILGDYHLAEDAAQEAFVDAYRRLPSLREPAAFGAWFRTIVFKHCDRLTRHKRPDMTGLHAAMDVATSRPSPDETMEAHEIQTSLRAAIAMLSETEQQVVLLYYMGGHSHAAIAHFLVVTTNAVKTRLYSARRHLRNHMGDVEKNLRAARPSSDPAFAEKVQRLIRPEALMKNEPLLWAPGMGAAVWEMFCASIIGDLDTVTRLVNMDASLVRSHYEYRTPLSFAVRENQLEVAESLLDHGAEPLALGDLLEVARDRGYLEMENMLARKLAARHGASSQGEPVAAAIRERDRRKAQRLLDEAPERLHAGDGRSNQPIHWAVMTRQIDIIDDLLDRGANIDARRQDGARPIHLTNGDYGYRGWRDVPKDVVTTLDDVYRHLVARGAHVDLGMAAVKGDQRRVQELLDEDPALANRVSEYGSYYLGCGAPLKNAAATGHIEIVKLLLARGADPNLPEEGIAPRGHALYSAVANGHFEIAKLLLDHGAYPNVEVESSADTVSRAIMNGDTRMIALLASYGATWEMGMPLPDGLTYEDIVATNIRRTVRVLAYYDDLPAATALFAANPALADDPEAFEAAAGRNDGEFMRLMLRYQPDLPTRVTVSKPREAAERLFTLGMDPNRPNWLRITPLHVFAERGDVESAAIFIDHGADLHARDEEHRSTPLGYAAMAGQTRMVEFLLRRGARPTVPEDPPWATPLAWATRRGHHDIVRVLTECAQSGIPPVHGLEHYERLARDLVEASDSGDDVAFRHVMDHFRIERPLTWDQPSRSERVARLRRHAREHLGGPPNTGSEAEPLTLAEARGLIARSEGFESWPELVKHRRD
jgi:RNA polymerase sigma factor (sigma-70 family)